MKTGLIITGGRIDLAFAGEFLRKPLMRKLNEKSDAKLLAAPGHAASERTRRDCNVIADGMNIYCIVAVDAGLAAAEHLGLCPTAVVGDFDTVGPDVLDRYRKIPEILWDVHKSEKDETDTELAINTAAKLGCKRVIILGATGGRLDHELSNIHLLKMCLDMGIEAFIYDRYNKLYLLSGSKTFVKKNVYGKYVSLIPFTENVRGIRLEGFKYPLDGKDISIGVEAGLCVSNEVEEETARITFDEGILICIESRD